MRHRGYSREEAGAGEGERRGGLAGTSGTSGWAVCESEARKEAARLRLGEAWRGESRARRTLGKEEPGSALVGTWGWRAALLPLTDPRRAENEPEFRRRAAGGDGLGSALRRWTGVGTPRARGAGPGGGAGAGAGARAGGGRRGAALWGVPALRCSSCSCARSSCCGGASGCCWFSPSCPWGCGLFIWNWWRRPRSAGIP